MDDTGAAALGTANRAALMAELKPGEQLLWASQPSRQMQVAGCVMWVFALPFIGFGLVWEAITGASLLTGKPGWPELVAALFGLPFLGIGLAAAWQPFKLRREVQRTIFAFTDLRMLRIVRGPPTMVSEVPMDSIGAIDRATYSDGSGTMSVQTFGPPDANGERPMVTYQLLGVRDVERGYKLLSERAR